MSLDKYWNTLKNKEYNNTINSKKPVAMSFLSFMPHLSTLSTFGTYPSSKPFSTPLSLRLWLHSLLDSVHSTWPELFSPSRTCTVSHQFYVLPSFFLPLLSLSRNGFWFDCESKILLSFFFFLVYWDFGNFWFFETGFYWELGKKKKKGKLLYFWVLNDFFGLWVKKWKSI